MHNVPITHKKPALHPKTHFVKSYANAVDVPATNVPQIVLLGRSNAGKSSLINALTGEKNLAKTSATPGRTRLINVFEVQGRYCLVDLPGYGFSKLSKMEGQKLHTLIQDYLDIAKQLRLAMVVVDSRIGPMDSDRNMLEILLHLHIPFLIVANKIDKLSKTQLHQSVASMRKEYPDMLIIPHSAITGAGRGELANAIASAILSPHAPPPTVPLPKKTED